MFIYKKFCKSLCLIYIILNNNVVSSAYEWIAFLTCPVYHEGQNHHYCWSDLCIKIKIVFHFLCLWISLTNLSKCSVFEFYVGNDQINEIKIIISNILCASVQSSYSSLHEFLVAPLWLRWPHPNKWVISETNCPDAEMK